MTPPPPSDPAEANGDDLEPLFEDALRDDALEPGAVIADRYRVERLLGEGGMGKVYLAQHVRVGRMVALKVMGVEWLPHPEIARRFRDEARAASAAGHPNIIEIFDADELPDGRPYLVMEYLEGEELIDFITKRGRLEPELACRIMADVAEALAAAHAHDIIHRDLKAENIMVTERAGGLVVKVLDFGIAAIRDSTGRRKTAIGQVIGTPAYMAPEQAQGKRVTLAVDLYALGLLLHECLTGMLPFEEFGPVGMLAIKVNEPAPSLATVRQDLDDQLVALVDQCLAMEPDDRPVSAAEVAARLRTILARPSPPAVVPAVVEATGTSRSLGLEGWAMLGAVLLLLVMIGIGTLLSDDARSPVEDPPGAVAVRTPASTPLPYPELELPPPEPEPEPEPTPEPEPEPSSPSPQESAKTPLPALADAGDPAPGSLCWRTRKQATQARAMHDWKGVLRHTDDVGCWSGKKTTRLRLRVKAYMEQGQWDACIRTGRGLRGSDVQSWVDICQRRKELP